MKKAILRNALSGETVRVTSAKGRFRGGKVIDVWIDDKGTPLCAIGGESPTWTVQFVDSTPVIDKTSDAPRLPFGNLSR